MPDDETVYCLSLSVERHHATPSGVPGHIFRAFDEVIVVARDCHMFPDNLVKKIVSPLITVHIDPPVEIRDWYLGSWCKVGPFPYCTMEYAGANDLYIFQEPQLP